LTSFSIPSAVPAAVVSCARWKPGGALYPVFFGAYDPEEAAKLGVTVSGTQVRSSGPQLAELRRLLDAGTLRVAIDSTFPLAEARGAHERAARGHIQGKIVLTAG
jgi:NADPH:quinone reductase-like Zn-dependent oxidoreductase